MKKKEKRVAMNTLPAKTRPGELIGSLSTLASLSMDDIFNKAVEIFGEQALLTKKPEDITIADLELSRLKSGNFLESLRGLQEVSHQMEVISAEKDRFKRGDELKILNSLLRTCASSATCLEDNVNIAYEKLSDMKENITDADPEKLAMLQSVINSNVDTAAKLTSSLSRLIQLERMSGSRPWGDKKLPMANAAQLSAWQEMERSKQIEQGAYNGNGPRRFTVEEVEGFLEKARETKRGTKPAKSLMEEVGGVEDAEEVGDEVEASSNEAAIAMLDAFDTATREIKIFNLDADEDLDDENLDDELEDIDL